MPPRGVNGGWQTAARSPGLERAATEKQIQAILFARFTAAREYAVAGQWPNVKDAGEFPMNSFS